MIIFAHIFCFSIFYHSSLYLIIFQIFFYISEYFIQFKNLSKSLHFYCWLTILTWSEKYIFISFMLEFFYLKKIFFYVLLKNKNKFYHNYRTICSFDINTNVVTMKNINNKIIELSTVILTSVLFINFNILTSSFFIFFTNFFNEFGNLYNIFIFHRLFLFFIIKKIIEV